MSPCGARYAAKHLLFRHHINRTFIGTFFVCIVAVTDWFQAVRNTNIKHGLTNEVIIDDFSKGCDIPFNAATFVQRTASIEQAVVVSKPRVSRTESPTLRGNRQSNKGEINVKFTTGVFFFLSNHICSEDTVEVVRRKAVNGTTA